MGWLVDVDKVHRIWGVWGGREKLEYIFYSPPKKRSGILFKNADTWRRAVCECVRGHMFLFLKEISFLVSGDELRSLPPSTSKFATLYKHSSAL